MFNEIKNTIDFTIRNTTRFSRKNFIEKNTTIIKYNEQENLYIYDILSKFFTKIDKNSLNILDIGSKNWSYAKGEHKFFNDFCNNIQLDGVELDAFRLYNNFYSRYEVAKYHIKNLKNTTYIPDNLLNLNKNYDYITWFLPFITINPLIKWGLPKKYFCPLALLSHAYKLLNTNGQMLILNQGILEAEIQEKLFLNLAIPYQNLGIIKSEFLKYQYERYGWLIKKD